MRTGVPERPEIRGMSRIWLPEIDEFMLSFGWLMNWELSLCIGTALSSLLLAFCGPLLNLAFL